MILNNLKEKVWEIIGFKCMIYFRDKLFFKSTKLHKLIRRLLLPYVNQKGYDLFDFYMTRNLANEINSFRGTWRALSNYVSSKYPNLGIEPADQKDGEWLRQYAEEYERDHKSITRS